MKLKRPSPAMVVAVVALVMSMTGGAIAAVNFAQNAGSVDGYSAVKASKAGKAKAAGKLVATYKERRQPRQAAAPDHRRSRVRELGREPLRRGRASAGTARA